MEKQISKLNKLIFEEESEEKIEVVEELIQESIEEAADIQEFYELPTENLLRIIKNSKTENLEIIKKLVYKISNFKEEDAPLILNVIDIDASLDDLIEIVSKLWKCPICKRISDIKDRDKELPMRDFEGEIKDLKQQIEVLEEENYKLKNESSFPKVTRMPRDYESDICKAAEDGKLTSVIYQIESTLHDNLEKRDYDDMTPLNWASRSGHIDVVKYLYDKYHAEVETKDRTKRSPLNNASLYGRVEVVKYLTKYCHADVETRDETEWSPLNNAARQGHFDVVKYLIKDCHADIETMDKYGHTPLFNASEEGYVDVVECLVENGACITEECIDIACQGWCCPNTQNKDKIKEYLRSHKK